jgi:rhamnogalacturonan acetylesterase
MKLAYARLGRAIALMVALTATIDATRAQEQSQGEREARPQRGNRREVVTPEATPRDSEPWTPTRFEAIKPDLPTLFIASDSTAATGGLTTRGWGAVMIDYFDTDKLNIINCAVGGRSFRTFTSEGRWDAIVEHLKPGDFVIIELGHNDGGGAQSRTGRGDVPGIGDETETVTRRDGSTETVHTFGWYARKYVRDARAKGATPILSTTTVRNIWRDGGVERGMGRMLEWLHQVAQQENALFLDHSNIAADRYEALGQEETAKFHPQDHTHTSTGGAILNAETLIAGLKTLEGEPLVQFLNDKGRAIAAHPRGPKWSGYGEPGPARLGIALLQQSGPATVGEIQPGTAADKAGLKPRDVITEYGGVAISDYAALTAEVAKAKSGDRVSLKVLRDGRSLDISVTFGAWSGDASANTDDGEGAQRDAPFGLDRRGRPLRFPPGVEPGMPHPDFNAELPTLWLIGDSTVKEGRDNGLNGGRWGWGRELARYFDLKRINVENQALGGTSSRSFRTGGWWEPVLEMIKPGDFVIMQFGHNDGGLNARGPARIRARGSLPGAGDDTVEGQNEQGETEVAHTYGWYLREYVADIKAKGATPIICSLIPRNSWRDGHMVRGGDDSFVGWAREAAAMAEVPFIDLHNLICDDMEAMGETFARRELFRPDDGTHTNLFGAQLNARCVVAGIKALSAETKLAEYLSPTADPVQPAGEERVVTSSAP